MNSSLISAEAILKNWWKNSSTDVKIVDLMTPVHQLMNLIISWCICSSFWWTFIICRSNFDKLMEKFINWCKRSFIWWRQFINWLICSSVDVFFHHIDELSSIAQKFQFQSAFFGNNTVIRFCHIFRFSEYSYFVMSHCERVIGANFLSFIF